MLANRTRIALEILQEQARPPNVYGTELVLYGGDVRFPDAGLRSIVYIGHEKNKQFEALGTGFIVEVQRHFGPLYYLVTAQHVVRRIPEPNKFAVRINQAEGKFRDLRFKGVFRWWGHVKDKSVDAVVYPWGMSPARFPFTAFPASRFLTPSMAVERNIGVGDEAFIVGLFRKLLPYSSEVLPMVRTGHISMMATERRPTARYGLAFMHLIEAFPLKGFSGSPVFVFETVSVPINAKSKRKDAAKWLRGAGNIFLLGLLHGILPVKVSEELTQVAKQSRQMWHTGISQVVPANQILEILNQPELLKYEMEMKRKIDDLDSVEMSIDQDSQKTDKAKRKTRDISIPPISQDKFFGALKKVTQRRKPS